MLLSLTKNLCGEIMKQILIKADDYGFTEAVSLGILLAHKNGIVKNTGMMVNMPAAIQAAEWIKEYPDLCLGLHTNLIVGKPCADPKLISGLLQENGEFISSKIRREQIASGIDPFNEDEVIVETIAQVERFNHLNSKYPEYIETHAVMSQSIQNALVKVANMFDIKILPHHQPSKWSLPQFTYNNYDFYKTNLPYYLYFKEKLDLTADLILFVLHPGFVDQDLIRHSSLTMERLLDYEMMIDSNVKKALIDKGYEIISFREII